MVLNDAGVIGLSLNGKSFPATQAYTRQGRRHGDGQLLQRGPACPPDAPAPAGRMDHRQGRQATARCPIPGDTINIAPGERYTVLYKLTDPGVWAWHCHILTHAEGADGMFGMVTAFIVEP